MLDFWSKKKESVILLTQEIHQGNKQGNTDNHRYWIILIISVNIYICFTVIQKYFSFFLKILFNETYCLSNEQLNLYLCVFILDKPLHNRELSAERPLNEQVGRK